MKNKKLLDYYLNIHYSIKIDFVDDDDSGYYVAHIPELGSGAFLGTGSTVDEALNELESIKRSYFEEHIEKGIKIPVPKETSFDKTISYSGKFLLRIPKTLHAKLAKQAEANGVSLNSYVSNLLSEYAEKYNLIKIANMLSNKMDMVLLNTRQIKTGMEKLNIEKFDIKYVPSKYKQFTENVFTNKNLPGKDRMKIYAA